MERKIFNRFVASGILLILGSLIWHLMLLGPISAPMIGLIGSAILFSNLRKLIVHEQVIKIASIGFLLVLVSGLDLIFMLGYAIAWVIPTMLILYFAGFSLLTYAWYMYDSASFKAQPIYLVLSSSTLVFILITLSIDKVIEINLWDIWKDYPLLAFVPALLMSINVLLICLNIRRSVAPALEVNS